MGETSTAGGSESMMQENIIFLILGIMLGVFLQIGWNRFCGQSSKKRTQESDGEGEDEWEDEDDSEDEQASNANVEQSAEKDKALFEQFPIDDVKQVFCVRTDLGMTKGKIGAQVGHATLGAYNTTKKWA